VCRLVSGEVDMQDSLALTDKEVENGYILTCQSYAKTDVEIEFI
jgi:ring-1,2-phenylacetyl-CoA epoxidase subunit PaaE